MADILEFGKKAENCKWERDNTFRQLKIEALRKIFQCSRCVVKCSKCGAQVDSQEYVRFAAPYNFCKSCMQEYEEFRARAGGNHADSDCYWRNSAWMRVWETWLKHQDALDQYRQSKEFLQLMDEVEQLLKK
jgi:DNA replicative helicase MCM subunit Mcm2 (Cdc46/Mcm family)